VLKVAATLTPIVMHPPLDFFRDTNRNAMLPAWMD
jgi:hypothetical protein